MQGRRSPVSAVQPVVVIELSKISQSINEELVHYITLQVSDLEQFSPNVDSEIASPISDEAKSVFLNMGTQIETRFAMFRDDALRYFVCGHYVDSQVVFPA